MITNRIAAERRFWSKVLRSEGCWQWSGTILSNGYGQFGVAGTRVLAHRYSYLLHNGPVAEGLCVLHRCDNRSCVRPDHLFLGTQKDNMDDKVSKGRQAKGESNGFAKLSETEVAAIREMCRRWPTSRSQKSGIWSFLARWFGVSQGTIRFVGNNQTWRN